MILIFITLFAAVFYVSFLVRIFFGLSRLSVSNNKNVELPDVTVIIPFRNEEASLRSSLQSLEAQTYPRDKFKCIYIDDHSTDQGPDIIREYKGQLLLEIIENEQKGKKQAIELAVRNIDSDIVVITDADCVHPKGWLESLVSNFEEDTGFIAGPVKFASKGGLFDSLQQLEFSGIVIAFAGLIASGMPFTCSAANIAFRKQAFVDVNGYQDNLHVPSGDDEFLMQKIAYESDWKVKYAVGKDVVVETKANKGIGEFINQRSRWASKGFNYIESLITLQLLVIFIFFVSIPINFIMAFIDARYLLTGLLAFILKFLVEYLVLLKGKKKIFNELSLKYFWLAELLHIPYIIIVSLLGTLGIYSWKGRGKQ